MQQLQQFNQITRVETLPPLFRGETGTSICARMRNACGLSNEGQVDPPPRRERLGNITLLCLMLVSIATQSRPNGAVKFIASERHALSHLRIHAARIQKHVYLLAMNIIDALSGRLLERNIIAR